MRAAFPRFAAMRHVLRIPRAHEWCLLAVLVFMTDRYRWMMDDAFIYFRYADNLLFLGRGLTYNAGEYVEGYSSPFWMLWMVAWRATRIDYYTLVRGLGDLSALAYGAGLVWVNRRLSPETASLRDAGARDASARMLSVNFPLAASAAHYGITTHFSSGLETPLLQLLAVLYAAALLSPQCALLQCAVALAPLVRAECGLLAVLYLGFLLVRLRRVPWWFVGCSALANGGWLAFRVMYYADFLPNTFYLKDGSHWYLGREYWRNVWDTHGWSWWCGLLVICAWVGRSALRREWMSRAVMIAAALLYALYVARIGGDMLYHRYAALPICLGLCASAGVVEAALRANRLALLHPHWVSAGVALLVCAGFGLAYPPQLFVHPFFLPPTSRKWEAIADPNWHRRHPNLEYTSERAGEDVVQRAGYARLRASGGLAQPPILVEGFCVLAFARFDAQIVHDYGLTDLALARLPRPFGRPGHKLVQVEAGQVGNLRKLARAGGAAWYELPRAPRWVAKNRDALAILEAKLHNSHVLGENLQLALTRVKLR